MSTAEQVKGATESGLLRNLGGDHWLQIPATWGAYLRLERARRDKATPQYTYCNGRLTIVSPGMPHEIIRSRIVWLIETMLVELRIPFMATGSVTLKQGAPVKKGVEGDTSYYLSNIDRIRGKRTLEMGVDPAPDLEVEVVISHPVRDALLVHASFGVREVWVCKEAGLTFLRLEEKGRYHVTPTSVVLPFLSPDDLNPWVFAEHDPDELTARQGFRARVIETIAPRLRVAEGGEQR